MGSDSQSKATASSTTSTTSTSTTSWSHSALRVFTSCVGVDVRSVALLRFTIGLIVIGDVVNRARDIHAHYSDDGVPSRFVMFSVFHNKYNVMPYFVTGEYWGVAALMALHCAVALAQAVGFYAHTASVLNWLLTNSLMERNRWVLHGGDVLLRCLLFWLCFLPVGRAWSVDAVLSRVERTRRAGVRVAGADDEDDVLDAAERDEHVFAGVDDAAELADADIDDYNDSGNNNVGGGGGGGGGGGDDDDDCSNEDDEDEDDGVDSDAAPRTGLSRRRRASAAAAAAAAATAATAATTTTTTATTTTTTTTTPTTPTSHDDDDDAAAGADSDDPRARLPPLYESRRMVANFASFGIVVQIMCMYVFAYKAKTVGDAWFADGSAVYWALTLQYFQRPLARLLLMLPYPLLQLSSRAVAYFQLLGPFSFVVPWQPLGRLLGVAGFTLMHSQLGWALYLGMFYWVTLAAPLVLLPCEFWNAFTRVALRRRRVPLASPWLHSYALPSTPYAALTLWHALVYSLSLSGHCRPLDSVNLPRLFFSRAQARAATAGGDIDFTLEARLPLVVVDVDARSSSSSSSSSSSLPPPTYVDRAAVHVLLERSVWFSCAPTTVVRFTSWLLYSLLCALCPRRTSVASSSSSSSSSSASGDSDSDSSSDDERVALSRRPRYAVPLRPLPRCGSTMAALTRARRRAATTAAARLQRLSSSTSAWSRVRSLLSTVLLNAVCLFFLLLVLRINIDAHKVETPLLKSMVDYYWLGDVAHVHQYWGMFSPNPPAQEFWLSLVVMTGEANPLYTPALDSTGRARAYVEPPNNTSDVSRFKHAHYELWMNKGVHSASFAPASSVEYAVPDDGEQLTWRFRNHRWIKFFEHAFLNEAYNMQMLPEFAAYLCREWNARQPLGARERLTREVKIWYNTHKRHLNYTMADAMNPPHLLWHRTFPAGRC